MASAVTSRILSPGHGREPDAQTASSGHRRAQGAQGVEASHESVRKQMLCTLSGAVVLLLCLLAIALTWWISFRQNREALESMSEELRTSNGRLMSTQIATIIRPTWSVPRQFVDRLATGSQQDGHDVIPPTPETFSNETLLNSFCRALAPYVNRETHMRTTNADLSEIEHNQFVKVGMVLAVNADNQPAPGPVSNCTKTLWGIFMLDAQTRDTYIADVSFLDPAKPVPDPAAPFAGTSRRIQSFDHLRHRLGPTLVSDVPHQLTCNGFMEPLWNDRGQLEGAYNFSYFGPYKPINGWGYMFEGSVPIYNEQRQQIGRVSSAISMTEAFGPLLQQILRSSRVLTGGVALVYTSGGVLMGTSEAGATIEDLAPTLQSLKAESISAQAVLTVEVSSGLACPAEQRFLRMGEWLVDVTPFQAEQHGMPPLPERWCQLEVIPAANIFRAFDDAQNMALAVGGVSVTGFGSALCLLSASLFLAVRAQRRMKAEELLTDLATIKEAKSCMTSLMSPMVLVRAEDFLKSERFLCHESWRDMGKTKVLDSVEAVLSFRAQDNLIVFLSHQWLNDNFPDTDDNLQLGVMQDAVAWFVESEAQKNVYVWVDFISINQRHRMCQRLAVSSLPAYVALVDRFVICAPDATHGGTGQPVGLESYSLRGWCRAEMLSKACSGGIQNMFVIAGGGEDCKLRPFTEADMSEMSLNVYAGNFTDEEDKAKLVIPVLGLYWLILRQSERDDSMNVIREHIEARKSQFFPAWQQVKGHRGFATRKLFGNLVALVEKHAGSEEDASCWVDAGVLAWSGTDSAQFFEI